MEQKDGASLARPLPQASRAHVMANRKRQHQGTAAHEETKTKQQLLPPTQKMALDASTIPAARLLPFGGGVQREQEACA